MKNQQLVATKAVDEVDDVTNVNDLTGGQAS